MPNVPPHDAPPLVIEVRANEFVGKKNPNVPWGAQEIVADALACADAGATGFHWHAVDDDGRQQSNDAGLNGEIIAGIRTGSRMFLHQTLGFTATQGEASARVRAVVEQAARGLTPDVVPVDIGAVVTNLFERGRFSGEDAVLLNHTGYLVELLEALQSSPPKVMAVVWSPGAVRTAMCLREMRFLPGPTFWQLGFTDPVMPGGPPATERQLDAFLDELPADEPWTVHVREGEGLAMAAWAILRGGHVSIGLGDDPYERLGLPGNADLVSRVRQIAESVGRRVATVEEARSIIGV